MNPGNPPHPNAHFVAGIRYPNVTQLVPPEAVSQLLIKASATIGRVKFQWSNLNRPGVGECFLEMRSTLSSVSGDGYKWTGIVQQGLVQLSSGDKIEVTRYSGGINPEDPLAEMCRLEYRIPSANDRLYFIHYLSMPHIVPQSSGGGTTAPVQQQKLAPSTSIRPTKMTPSKKHVADQAPKAEEVPDLLIGIHFCSTLTLDDADMYTPIDNAFKRSLYLREVFARFFHPPAAPLATPPSFDEEIEQLLRSQIGVMRLEIEKLEEQQNAYKVILDERRQKLNRLWSKLEDPSWRVDNSLWQEWEEAAGYRIKFVKPFQGI